MGRDPFSGTSKWSETGFKLSIGTIQALGEKKKLLPSTCQMAIDMTITPTFLFCTFDCVVLFRGACLFCLLCAAELEPVENSYIFQICYCWNKQEPMTTKWFPSGGAAKTHLHSAPTGKQAGKHRQWTSPHAEDSGETLENNKLLREQSKCTQLRVILNKH